MSKARPAITTLPDSSDKDVLIALHTQINNFLATDKIKQVSNASLEGQSNMVLRLEAGGEKLVMQGLKEKAQLADQDIHLYTAPNGHRNIMLSLAGEEKLMASLKQNIAPSVSDKLSPAQQIIANKANPSPSQGSASAHR